MRLPKSFLIVNLIFAIFTTSCTRQTDKLPSATENTLRIVTSFKIQNLNPTKPAQYFLLEFGAIELPLKLNENSQIEPWLLESYEQTDALNWKLRIRPDVLFQNGKPLTTQIFAAAMNRQLALSAETRSVLPDASVKVLNEREILLTTKNPDATVPSALADETAFPIYDVETVEKFGDNDQQSFVGSGCYTGPYKIVGLDERELRLERNEIYWRGMPPLEKVSVKFITEPQARILAVQNDEADIALYPPMEAKRILANRNDAFFVTNQANGGAGLSFNVKIAPFNEVNVRRAVSLGINYETLAKDVLDGVFDTATGFYPPNLPWAIPSQKTDPEAAKKLLDEAGWTANADGLRSKNGTPLKAVLLVYPQQPDLATMATAVQAQLREIGFNVEIRQVDDINETMKTASDWNFATLGVAVLTTGGSPVAPLREKFSFKGERNYGGINDDELDTKINELSQAFDAKRRDEILKRIQEIVSVEKAYGIRLVFSRARAVVGRRYKSYKPSAVLHHVTFETKPDF